MPDFRGQHSANLGRLDAHGACGQGNNRTPEASSLAKLKSHFPPPPLYLLPPDLNQNTLRTNSTATPMMGLLSGLQGGANNVRKRVGGGSGDQDRAPEGSNPDDTSILDENEGSIVMSIISQLRYVPSALSAIQISFSGKSFRSYSLSSNSHLSSAENDPQPEERFIRVLRYYLSGWHIKPKGVKKPYNPVLGEFFRCRYDYPNGTQAFYIAEQVSHHPPISAYFYISPANKVRHVRIVGELRPKSKFLGNSVMTVMEGENRVLLMGKPEDGEYVISMPNMYARGILFGKMVLELGDMCAVKCEKTGMVCDVEFKTKGFFSGGYNGVSGRVKQGNTDIAEVSGLWSSSMEYKSLKTNDKRVLFDAAKENIVEKFVYPEEEQEPNESQRLWTKLTDAIHHKDMEAATDAKSAVENAQREAARKREETGTKHVPRFFEQNKAGQWVGGNGIPSNPDAAVKFVEEWIWPKQTAAQPSSPSKAANKAPAPAPAPTSSAPAPTPAPAPAPTSAGSPGAISATSS
ncbi:oxysterol-binding protein family [Rhizoctonia solani AG-1 IA]|uniref:Oxysterol-binding protein family n=1 Tax=Thanatephorus cucumeris (strain AG1-IA) TaxID=983506 RepID=L8X3V2_THACA|nr:oxysterol-binding protein family [Rhizoctonia solani AG-1 IA]